MAKTLEDTFWATVLISKDGCWIWQGQTERDGYGKINRAGNKVILAHRLSYEMHKGPIPEGYVVDHLCNTRRCVNPKHLQAVTQTVNCQNKVEDVKVQKNSTNGISVAEEPIHAGYMLMARKVKQNLAELEMKGFI